MITRRQKDFEQFLKDLPNLDPASFCGLCNILGVSMVEGARDAEADKNWADFKEKLRTVEDKTELKEEFEQCKKEQLENYPPRLAENILEDLMDAFLKLQKKGRKEILKMLKDYKRGK